jgi:hypothetical protein
MKVKLIFFEGITPDKVEEINVENFNWDGFEIVETNENEISGWYGEGSISGQHYISVTREDYERHKLEIIS